MGRSLQTYDLKKGLGLVFITRPQTPENITATLAWKKVVIAAWGGESPETTRGVWLFQRGKKVGELEMPRGLSENITQVVAFGEWIVGACASRIEVWKSSTLEHYTSLIGASSSPLSGGICTMPTYLNKIFAGRQDGSVEIWNLSSAKLLYTFLPPAASFGAITALEPTPVLSLLAIAYESGPVVIHDIRSDKEVLRLNIGGSSNFPVTSISFRTDGIGAGDDGTKEGVMATASRYNGDVTFWDLNGGGRKMGVLRGAHQPPPQATGGIGGGISRVEFLAGQAVIVSSGLDNSLKTWIFDETPFSAVPRPLHSRSGHAATVSSLRFLPFSSDGTDDTGKWLLSASQDRSLWGWSLRRDAQSTELSQGNVQKKAKKLGLLDGVASKDKPSASMANLKAPAITCMACSLNRDGGMGAMPGVKGIWNNSSKVKGDSKKKGGAEVNMTGWESIITGHAGSNVARTWFWGRKRAGRWAFKTTDETEVKVRFHPFAFYVSSQLTTHRASPSPLAAPSPSSAPPAVPSTCTTCNPANTAAASPRASPKPKPTPSASSSSKPRTPCSTSPRHLNSKRAKENTRAPLPASQSIALTASSSAAATTARSSSGTSLRES